MRALLLVIGLMLTALATPLPAAAPDIPASLEPWRGWVLEGEGHRSCPFLLGQGPGNADKHVCAWPGRLQLDVERDGARFSLRWRVLRETEVQLPGDARHPPLDVRVGGQPQAVQLRGVTPVLQLAAGEHQIEGRLDWSRRPETLVVPEAYALLALRLDGQDIAVPEREGARLWLGRTRVAEAEDSLSLKVFRHLADGVPQILSTQLQLEVGGRAREERLGVVLPAGFVPMSLQGGLPASIDSDGALRVQLRPGRWSIDLKARALSLMDSFAAVTNPVPWPTEEIWSFAADPRLRVLQPSADAPVDPAQVGVPFGNELPAFLLGEGSGLRLEERSRGLPPDAANRLALARELWLDFSGSGFTARDHINGRLVQGTRLDMAPPWRLERAAANGEDLLITAGSEQGSGVELRQTELKLESTARLEGGGSLPINGWRQTFDDVEMKLNLPPGWALAHASGVDRAPESWSARWSLLDIFLMCLAVLLAHRALGVPLAALVLAYLLLGYHESDAPLWTLIAVLALGLFVRWLPAGGFARVLRVAALLFFAAGVLLSLPFAGQQLKLALYPQLERERVLSGSEAYGRMSRVPHAVLDYASQNVQQEVVQAEPLERVEVAGSRVKRVDMAPASAPARPVIGKAGEPNVQAKRNLNQYPADAVLQAGRGDPDWQWKQLSLSLAGPVSAEQNMRLWLSPPWLTRGGRLLLVTLLGLILWRVLPSRWIALPEAADASGPGAAPASASLALLAMLPLAGLLGSAPLQAQDAAFPPAELLVELRERLLRAPDCVPDCARLANAELRLIGNRLRLSLELHASADVVVPLPEAGKLAAPLSATVDGLAVPLLRQRGQSWLRLSPGLRRAEIELVVAEVDGFDLRFPLAPGRIAAQADGWEIAGLDSNRLQGDSLQLLRQRRSAASAAAGESDEAEGEAARPDFPPFVQIERSLDLGLDWTVVTRVQRLAPASAGFTVEVPLLPGERLQNDTLPRREGRVQLGFSRGQDEISWRSTLPVGESLSLTAGELARYAEVWQVSVGPFWRVAFSGTPAVASYDPGVAWSFLPFPGETLSLAVSRPEALSGDSLAIDVAALRFSPGKRASDATLSYTLRATRGGQQALTLPHDAELLRVVIDGREHHLKLEQGRLGLPVVPGQQRVEISWRQPQGLTALLRSPAVDLGTSASNISLEVPLPERWLLLSGGSGVGPAVLYWPQLALLLLIAFALARLGGTPLGYGSWLLLGLGFSTVSWLAAAIVAGWLLLLGLRGRSQALPSSSFFALAQVGLILLSILALMCLIAAIPYGLLNQPDMRVAGNGSSAGFLRWFFDRSSGEVPGVWVFSLPLWAYKIAILAWSLWLANALLGWLRWGWGSFASGGMWPKPDPNKKAKARKAERVEPPPPPKPATPPDQDKPASPDA